MSCGKLIAFMIVLPGAIYVSAFNLAHVSYAWGCRIDVFSAQEKKEGRALGW